MRFHLPSFLLGCLFGAVAVPLAKRLRPAIVEIATTGYKLAESGVAAMASGREDLEDLLAEAKARVWPEAAKSAPRARAKRPKPSAPRRQPRRRVAAA